MGADLIVSVIELRESKEKAIERLAKIVFNEDSNELFQNAGYYFWEDEQEITPEILNDMRKRVASALEVVYGYSREMTHISIDGDRRFVITGGMSWGDMPTDIFEDFNIFQEFLAYPSWCALDEKVVKDWEGEI